MSSNHIATLPAQRRGAWAPRLLSTLIQRPDSGRLRIAAPGGELVTLGGRMSGRDVVLTVRNWRCIRRLLLGGDTGFAESFIDGDWTTPDLPQLLLWALENESGFSKTSRGNPVVRLARRLAHCRRANTKRGSRRNIAAHYDLGNAFYGRWLDRGMSYSSALFTSPGQSLEQAQEAKLDRVVDLLGIGGSERVLEIGFGWGGALERLVGRHCCRATGLTLSSEQLDYAQTRLARSGLAAYADLRLQDYRDIEDKFDRIVSIEMLEAVGERYWPVYFDKLRACLKPGGTCVMQVITIAEDRFPAYRRNSDFIQSYIFPGGMLPTKKIVREQVAKADLVLTAEESFGTSYARTLQEWRRRFLAAAGDIERLGFDARFRRMWEYYLAYCEAGFLGGSVDVTLYQIRG